jgi:hypothetical protein
LKVNKFVSFGPALIKISTIAGISPSTIPSTASTLDCTTSLLVITSTIALIIFATNGNKTFAIFPNV